MTEISVSCANQPGARLDVDDDTYKPPPRVHDRLDGSRAQ